jgi:hypothetical protein
MLGPALQLPDYINIEGVYFDSIKQELIIVCISPMIPDDVAEIAPIYTEEIVIDKSTPDWENAPRTRRLKQINLFDYEGKMVT